MTEEANKCEVDVRPSPGILEATLAQLFDGSLARRSATCQQLPRLWSSASETAAPAAPAFEKEVSKALLMQLLAPQLRLTALKALQQLPRWDNEVLNRAVRIPPFQKEDDGTANRPLEPWYGALFFVLDDEDQRIRAAVLRVLVAALCSKSRREKVPELEGLFQRLAQIASLCLHDTSEMVRNEAAAALVEVMTCRNVSLTATASLKDSPALETVLHAFPRDPRAVLEVMKYSRFGDVEAVQKALEWMLTVQPLEEQDLRVIAWHLSGEVQRIEEEPPPKKRKGSLRLDTSLPSGTRFLTASLLHGSSPMAPGGLAVALAQGRGSVRMERLETLVQFLNSRCDASSLRGHGALPIPASRSSATGDELRQQCLDLLSRYWQRSRELLQVEPSGPNELLKTWKREMLQKLSDLQRIFFFPAGKDEGSLSLPLAWAELFKSFMEASLWSGSGRAGQASAVKFHQAVSMLIYGFPWPQLPRDLVAFRLWSLRFLGISVELSKDHSQLMASLLDVNAPCPFPSLTARHEAHRNELFFPEWNNRWRVEGGNHKPLGHVTVDVNSSISKGLCLKLGDDLQTNSMIEVPPLGNARKSRRVFCPSCTSSVQLFLAVDAAGGDLVAEVKDPELLRLVNFIPLGKPEQLPS